MAAPYVSRRTLLLSAGSFLTAARLVRAQEQTAQPPAQPVQSDAKFESGVKVVNVFASVRNSKGEIVKDLTQNDFSLEEDGRPQTIKYFSRESNLPLTLGFLVDTSGSVRNVLDQEKTATGRFINQVMREDKDQGFLIHFDAEVELMEDLTNSKKKLQNALNDVEAAKPRPLQRRDPNGGGSYPSGGQGGGRPHGGTALYDAVLLASDEELRKQKGRKAIILLTDGVDNGSRTSLSGCIESAQRADTLVYSIMFAGENGGGGTSYSIPGMGRRGGMGGGGRRPPQQTQHADGKKTLERISKETGGSFFEAGKKQSLETIYDRIEEELRSQYSLGYTPDKVEAGFHKLHVSVKDKKMVVTSRDGYFGSAT